VSKKTVCEIPSHWKLSDWILHSCTDRSHRHITNVKASENVGDGVSEWIDPPRDRKNEKIVRVIEKNIPFRGTSSVLGSYLRKALAEQEDWAVTMVRSMHMKRETASQVNA
jgi:hypothetical protein